ncbi:MAG: DUF885 domain-containing protein [Deltaproteobacteria bacterium]|nr:DUF885 domain-containing protein [Deltaproteobacteria bacterium]
MTHPLPDLPFDDRHDIIKKEKLLEFFRLSPEFATVTGYHAFDDQMPHVHREAFETEFAFINTWLQELRRIPREQLSQDQRLDLALFEHCHALHHFYFRDLDLWQRGPEAITEIGQILFMTLLGQVADDETRFHNIASRLESAPEYVREHQSRMLPPPRRWRDIALQTTTGMLSFFDAITDAARAKASPQTAARVARGAEQAKAEAHRYVTWLQQSPVDDRELWVLGKDRFQELLRLRKLGMDAQEILALGEDALARYEAERRRLAKELIGSDDIEAAQLAIQADAPPDFETALRVTRETCEAAKTFLQQHRIVDLPGNERLDIIETPAFLRPLIPFAAIFPPARFAPVQQGTYMVTPPADMKQLARHLNYTAIYNTAVHEAYPGHHLQLSTANLTCSFLRSATFIGGKSAELVEGWAHYCEELMKQHGFHDTLQGRFSMVNDLVWRATRVIIDVKLSQGEMSVEAATQLLMKKTHIPLEAAQAELNRYTHSPTYQLSYLLGKHLILDLKRAVQQKEGATFDEASFHNRLLHAGSIPVSVIRRDIFGVAA